MRMIQAMAISDCKTIMREIQVMPGMRIVKIIVTDNQGVDLVMVIDERSVFPASSNILEKYDDDQWEPCFVARDSDLLGEAKRIGEREI